MVFLTKFLFMKQKPRTYLKTPFIDSLNLLVKGGPGGMGLPKFGGIGGNGGDVIFEAREGYYLNDMVKMLSVRKIQGSHGANSHSRAIIGRSGDNHILQVPVGVTIYNSDGFKIGELNQPGARITVAKGGLGGNPKTGFCGMKGESDNLKLELKLLADVGLVGFPNAGKSSFLKAISNSKPKIASYPFTTLKPQLGIAQYPDYRQISFADLPGLIEGAHVNIGMGHKFLKHIERTKLLLMIVDIMGFQLNPFTKTRSCIETILLLNKELELYKESLIDKPAMLIINKCDLENTDHLIKETIKHVDNLKEFNEKLPEDFRPERLIKFDHISVISAKYNTGIKEVLTEVRDILDFYAEKIQTKEPVGNKNNIDDNKPFYI